MMDTAELTTFAPGRLSTKQLLAIIALGLLILIPAIAHPTNTLSSHEVLAAQPAKEMLAGGHWIVQRFAGVPRYEKPPTASWLIAASMWIFHSDAAWAVRLPSILSGIASCIIIAMLGARWLGARVGLTAALLQLTTVWMQTQAKLSESDIHLVALVSAAMACFAVACVEHPAGVIDRRWPRTCFYLAAGLAFLFKGPAPLLFIFTGALAYIVIRRQWRTVKFFLDPIGIALFLLLLIAWPVAAYLSEPEILKAWRTELTGYASGEMGDRGFFVYFYNVPAMLLPWTLLLIPLAIAARQRHWFSRPFSLLLLAWFIPGMVILQATKYKSSHYTFPLLPPMSIAMAVGLLFWMRLQLSWRPLAGRALALLILLASAGGMLAVGLLRDKLPLSAAYVIGIAGIGLLLTQYLLLKRRTNASLAALFLSVAVTMAVAHWLVLPHFSNLSRREFANRINGLFRQQELYLVDFSTDALVWDLDMPLRRMDDVQQFLSLPAEGRIILARERTVDKLSPQYRVERIDELTDPKKSDLRAGKLPLLLKLSPQPTTAPATAISGGRTPESSPSAP